MRDIIKSFGVAKGIWKIILVIYAFQFLLASTVGLQMYQVLDASIGTSLSLKNLTSGFDYTVFMDFINVHGGSFSTLYGQMRWMVLIYLIFGSFISAGLIYILGNSEKSTSEFFKGGTTYFGRFFIIDIIFTLFIGVILGISLALVGSLFARAPLEFDTELVFLRWTLLIVIVAIFLIVILTLLKIKIKYSLLDKSRGIWSGLKSGTGSFWSNKWKLIGYSLLFLAVSVFLLFMNHSVGNLTLILMIIIQQGLMLFKIAWRVMYYNVIKG